MDCLFLGQQFLWMNATVTDVNWNSFQDECFTKSFQAGWWDGVNDENIDLFVPIKLCLIHSEISEAMEGHRKGVNDDKLPHRPAIEVELADAIIRIGDLSGRLGLDIGGAIEEKMAYNAKRLDHKRDVRAAEGGKKY